MREQTIPLPEKNLDQEAEITGAKFLLDKRIRTAITNKWGVVTMTVSIQNGRIVSVKDSDESVWKTRVDNKNDLV